MRSVIFSSYYLQNGRVAGIKRRALEQLGRHLLELGLVMFIICKDLDEYFHCYSTCTEHGLIPLLLTDEDLTKHEDRIRTLILPAIDKLVSVKGSSISFVEIFSSKFTQKFEWPAGEATLSKDSKSAADRMANIEKPLHVEISEESEQLADKWENLLFSPLSRKAQAEPLTTRKSFQLKWKHKLEEKWPKLKDEIATHLDEFKELCRVSEFLTDTKCKQTMQFSSCINKLAGPRPNFQDSPGEIITLNRQGLDQVEQEGKDWQEYLQHTADCQYWARSIHGQIIEIQWNLFQEMPQAVVQPNLHGSMVQYLARRFSESAAFFERFFEHLNCTK